MQINPFTSIDRTISQNLTFKLTQAEMEKVIALGVDPSRIIFAHPCKQASHIRAAQKLKVSIMTFDSMCELHKIKSVYPTARFVSFSKFKPSI